MNHAHRNWTLALLRALAALAALSAAAPASADSIDTRWSRFSRLEIVERGRHLHELISHGRKGNWHHPARPVEGTRNWRLVFETVIYWRGDADVVVLRRLENNNYCGGQYQFVLVPATGREQASTPGPACSGSILQMRVSPRAIELDVFAVRRPDLSHVTLRYDGSEMEEIEVPRDDSRPRIAGAGKDVTRWIGVHPAEILDDPTERRRFATIMARAQLYDLRHNTGIAFAVGRLVNGVLVARGCRPSVCGDNYGAIAIELATGRPYALIYDRETGLKVYGSRTLAEAPGPLQDIGAEWFSGNNPPEQR